MARSGDALGRLTSEGVDVGHYPLGGRRQALVLVPLLVGSIAVLVSTAFAGGLQLGRSLADHDPAPTRPAVHRPAPAPATTAVPSGAFFRTSSGACVETSTAAGEAAGLKLDPTCRRPR